MESGDQAMPQLDIDVEEQELLTDESVMPVADMRDLASMVDNHFEQARQGRLQKEVELIADLRAWKGEYGPEVQIEEGKSRVFVKLSRAWCSAARSLILSILGQEDGFPWTIDPTPLPEIEGINVEMLEEVAELAAKQLPPDQAEAFLAEHDFKSLVTRVQEEAQQKCDGMQKVIEDQLAEMKWEESFTRSLLPYVIYGTMVVQGPTSIPKRPHRWQKDVGGSWKLALQRWKQEPSLDLRPGMRMLDIFSVYPDPVGTKVEELEYIIVRHTPNRHELRNWKKLPNFDADEIENLLLEHAEHGDWKAEQWEAPVDATTDHTPTARRHDRFVVKEWWGFLSGQMLRDHGITVADDLLECECLVNLWECCQKIIKCVVSNMEPARLPFFFVPYEDVPNSIWGQGVPRQMDDSQALFNAAERAKVDNMGMAAGPQITIDASRISDREDAKRIRPWHVRFVSDMDGLTRDPVQIQNIPCNIEYFRLIQSDVSQHLQKETSIPDFLATGVPGNLAHNRTAEGLSMSQNQALGFIRTVIGNLDTYLTQGMIEALYNWNMAFNPCDDIKGDYDVVAKGVKGAMSREVLTQRLNQLLLAAGNPEISPSVKVDKAVQLWAKAMGYADMDLTYSLAEVQENRKKTLAMEAEAKSAPNRVQPIMPRENASMQLLLHTPPTSPMYGPAYEEVVQIWGLTSSKMTAALNAWNAAQTRAFAAGLDAQDAATLSAPISPEEANAPSSPAAGLSSQPQGGMPLSTWSPGKDAGMGTPGGVSQGFQG